MAQAGLAAGDEAAAVGACDIFAELIEAPAPILGAALPELVRWAMSVAGDGGLELGTRESAMQVCTRARALRMRGRSQLRERLSLGRRCCGTCTGPYLRRTTALALGTLYLLMQALQ